MHEGALNRAQYVLDTSAIYNATDYPAGITLFTSPEVLNELRRVYKSERAELFIAARVSVVSPSESSINAVTEKAKETGDIARLSRTDVEVLSLAFELGACIITEDYSIQNTACALGVSYTSLYIPPIKEFREWIVVCSSCGTRSTDGKSTICPVCGGRLHTRKKRERRLM